MPHAVKSKPSKKGASPKRTKRTTALLVKPIARLHALRERRAHKSFRLTRRRDIPKRAALPGYISFTREVVRAVWKFRRPFAWLLALFVIAALLLIGFSQQDQYRSLTDMLLGANQDSGTASLDIATQVAGLFGATLVGSLNGTLSQMQQFYLAALYVLMWLVVVWMLRQLVANNRIKVRDGLYNSGTPLLASLCIVALMLLQATPGALGMLIFSFVNQTAATAGVVAMCFGILALLLVVLSLYWLSSSFFALLIVTLPGTYPMQAIRGASEMALGRRTQLLFRLLWLVVLLFIIWAILLVPSFLIDLWLKASWLPLVTIMIEVATGVSFIFGISYIFLLYRRMIDEPAK